MTKFIVTRCFIFFASIFFKELYLAFLILFSILTFNAKCCNSQGVEPLMPIAFQSPFSFLRTSRFFRWGCKGKRFFLFAKFIFIFLQNIFSTLFLKLSTLTSSLSFLSGCKGKSFFLSAKFIFTFS